MRGAGKPRDCKGRQKQLLIPCPRTQMQHGPPLYGRLRGPQETCRVRKSNGNRKMHKSTGTQNQCSSCWPSSVSVFFNPGSGQEACEVGSFPNPCSQPSHLASIILFADTREKERHLFSVDKTHLNHSHPYVVRGFSSNGHPVFMRRVDQPPIQPSIALGGGSRFRLAHMLMGNFSNFVVRVIFFGGLLDLLMNPPFTEGPCR